MELVIIQRYTFDIYDFLREDETPEEGIKRAENYYIESLELVKCHWVNYGGDYWKKQITEYQNKVNAGCQVMTYDEYKKLERKKLLSDDLKEVTAEAYEDAFEVLPPLKFCKIQGVEMFCISEMYTGSYTTQYAKFNGKYYSKMVDVCDKSTWIYNYLIKEN